MLWIIAFVLFGCCCVSSRLVYDQLLRIHYDAYRKDWSGSGRPWGYWYFPEGPLSALDYRTWRASWNAPIRLIFKTPWWVHDSLKAWRLVLIYRAIIAIAFLIWPIALVIASSQ